MNSVFRQHQLLRCQTIEQCLILDADVHKEGKPHADKGEEVGKQVLIVRILYTDDPYESVILLSYWENRMMSTPALIREHPLRKSPREGVTTMGTHGTEGVKVNKDTPFKYY